MGQPSLKVSGSEHEKRPAALRKPEALVKASARPDGHKDTPAPVGVKSPVGALSYLY